MTRLEAERKSRFRESAQDIPRTNRQWIEIWEALEQQGWFKAEPDFPLALKLFREAVERNDPWPKETEWLIEIYERIAMGKPAVTEIEYSTLAEWYKRHEPQLYDVNMRSRLMQGVPRRLGATETVEKLRLLQVASPELH